MFIFSSKMVSIAQEDLSGKKMYLLLFTVILNVKEKYKNFFKVDIIISLILLHFSADSSSQHQSWWKWMLMPKPFYSNSGGSRRTSYSPTTQYPFTSSYQYPRGSMNGYFSSYQPYNRNPSNSYYTR